MNLAEIQKNRKKYSDAIPVLYHAHDFFQGERTVCGAIETAIEALNLIVYLSAGDLSSIMFRLESIYQDNAVVLDLLRRIYKKEFTEDKEEAK